jgi:hypothetical protein
VRTLLVVSFGTVVALVTAAGLTLLVVGLAVEEYQVATMGLLLWVWLAMLTGAGWAVWKVTAGLVRWAKGDVGSRAEERRHAETERRMRERGW